MLKDKVIIVTGAGSGIGLATAVILAEAGARVVLAGRTVPDIEAAATKVRAAGGDAVAVVADVSQESDVVAMVDRAVSEFGRLDGAFNNAGVEMRNRLTPDLTSDDWDRVFDVDGGYTAR